jgi:hypothetical protein
MASRFEADSGETGILVVAARECEMESLITGDAGRGSWFCCGGFTVTDDAEFDRVVDGGCPTLVRQGARTTRIATITAVAPAKTNEEILQSR